VNEDDRNLTAAVFRILIFSFRGITTILAVNFNEVNEISGWLLFTSSGGVASRASVGTDDQSAL
jgi:hypothetical protein